MQLHPRKSTLTTWKFSQSRKSTFFRATKNENSFTTNNYKRLSIFYTNQAKKVRFSNVWIFQWYFQTSSTFFRATKTNILSPQTTTKDYLDESIQKKLDFPMIEYFILEFYFLPTFFRIYYKRKIFYYKQLSMRINKKS